MIVTRPPSNATFLACDVRFAKGTATEDPSGHEVTADDKLGEDELSAEVRVAPPGTSVPGESIGLAA